MQLSYNEVMQRIAQYEKEDMIKYKRCRKYCIEKHFPYDINVYKGENQIIVVPSITSIGGFSVEMAWYHQITDVSNAQLLGDTILNALNHIRTSPVDARTKDEINEDSFIQLATSCKSYKSFNKKYLLCGFHLYEDGKIVVSQTHRQKNNTGYSGNGDKLTNLSSNSSAREIGEAIINSFNDMETIHKNQSPKKSLVLRMEFETVLGERISFVPPQGEHYTDEQDYHSAEIYQGYSYRINEGEEPIANMFFGISLEFDGDVSSENVQNTFEKQYGRAEVIKYEPIKHPIFDLRAEVINATFHYIVYLQKREEAESLLCELNLNAKKVEKQICTKIAMDFEDLINSCDKA